MKKKMILAGLAARPVRTTVSILAVALEVVLILVIVGLTNGISNETGKRTEGVGADILFQAPNSSLLLALSNSTMPVAIADKILEIDGVKTVAPVQTQVNSSAGLEVVYGIDLEKFNEITGGFSWHKGGPFTAADQVIVDDIYATAKHVAVGDEVTLLNHKFKIAGVVEHGKGARLFIPLKTAQDMSGALNRASLFYVKLNDSNQVNGVVEQMKQTFPGYGVLPLKEYSKLMMSSNMPALDAFLNTVVFVAACIGVLVIFLSMYTTITERTREIGILRSLGASKQFIVSLIFQESAIVCLIGVVLGIASSYVISRLVTAAYPTLLVMITPDWIVKATIFALLSGVIGSIYPSIKAAKQDPIQALAYE